MEEKTFKHYKEAAREIEEELNKYSQEHGGVSSGDEIFVRYFTAKKLVQGFDILYEIIEELSLARPHILKAAGLEKFYGRDKE